MGNNYLFRFREFPVYQHGRQFRLLVYRVSLKFPKAEVFGLTSQIRRAVNSILLNIAEGSNRMTDQDFGRFLNLSVTSLEEVVACCDIALDERYISAADHRIVLEQAELLGKQLIAFSAKLRKAGDGQKF
ncbi:MAG: four helix bundle protein [Candidatus Uhrbacteria bacterium]